ncbi:MAG TPA: tripartite tricarboxylate transporter substrate-binding protein [Xanthobacteraceae bacterium]
MPISRTIVAAVAWTALIVAPARAQEWPTRPLTMVVPFAAGGPSDVLARIIDPRLSALLGQQVIIENAGGAGGITGSLRVAKAASDGYQLVMGTQGTHAQNQALYKNPPYHPIADFAPLGLIVVTPLVLIARKDLPANNFKEFITYFKDNHGKMQFGSAGTGSGTHLGCVLLNAALGANVTHVPYRGSALAMQDLQGGRIDYMCDVVSTALPQIEGKTVKALAVLNRERANVLPDVPTAQEQGLTDFEAPGWFAFFLPKGTPAPIVARLNRALSDTLDTPPVRERLEGLGMGIPPAARRSPDYLARFVASEIEKWAPPIKAAGISLD